MASKNRTRSNSPSVTPVRARMLQRKCACGANISGGSECAECQKKTLQRASAGQAAPTMVPPVVHDVLRSPGQPLDAATRATLEPRFGHDFSRIKVHTDAKAADSARAVNALAYTVGDDVVFGRGQYRPGSEEGQRLIAHELTHTIQQAGGTGLRDSGPSERGLEGEAEAVSRAALDGQNVRVGSNAPLGLSRQPAPGADPSPAPAAVVETDPNTIDGFATGSAVISAANMAKLRIIASQILSAQKEHPYSPVRVIGHTDAQGNEGDNVALGMRRAVATRNALVGMGVPANVITTESRGQSEPVDLSGKKDSPRNRRAEVKFEAAAPPAQPAAPQVDPNPPKEPDRPTDPRKDPRFFPQPQLPPQQLPQQPVKPPYKPPPPEAPHWEKPLPPLNPALLPKSTLQRINDALDKEVNRITRAIGLPKWVQEKARDLAHTAFLKGTTAGLAAALAGLGVDAQGQKAIVTFVEAALKDNRWGGGPPTE